MWMMSDGHRGWGRFPTTNSHAINHRASFGEVKYCWSRESLGSWLSLELSLEDEVIWTWTPPPTSTTHCSRDTSCRCSQAFPVFRLSSTFVYYTECKPKNKNRRPGNKANLTHNSSSHPIHIKWGAINRMCIAFLIYSHCLSRFPSIDNK